MLQWQRQHGNGSIASQSSLRVCKEGGQSASSEEMFYPLSTLLFRVWHFFPLFRDSGVAIRGTGLVTKKI